MQNTTTCRVSLQDLLARVKPYKKTSDGYLCTCPSHNDEKQSLSISESGGKILLHCHAKCSPQSVCAALGISLSDLFEKPVPNGGKRQIAAVYDYLDETGRLLYQNVRYEPKQFIQRKPDGRGDFEYKLNGTRRVPYRLPELITALAEKPDRFVILCEGEKDADNLRNVGFIASNFKNWKAEFNEFINDANVVLIRDHDAAGVKLADDAATIIAPDAKSLKIVDLFESEPLPEKGGLDVSDWLADGRDPAELQTIIKNAPVWVYRVEGFAGFNSNEKPSNPESNFKFTPLDELIDEPAERARFVWDDTLSVGGFSICSAKPKVGKSTLARNLAVAITRGESFLGRETVQGKVLYLCLEEKRAEVAKHFRRMNASGADILIHTGTTPKDAFNALRNAILEHQPALCIIDPLARVLRGADFNDYGSMSDKLSPFIDLARVSGCHILAVHHDGKGERDGGDALLGSTALFASVDCHISMKKRERGRTVASTNRYGEDLPETVIELNPETGIITGRGDLRTVVALETERKILDAIGKGKLTEPAIKEFVGGSSGIVAKAIRDLVTKNVLFRGGQGGRKDPFVYGLNPQSESYENREVEKPSNDTDKQRGKTLFSNEGLEGLHIYRNPQTLNEPESHKECFSCGAKVESFSEKCPNCDEPPAPF